jgi:uncharacterized membrane protein
VKNLEYLSTYLEKLKVKYDKKELEFQFSSHPDYPSLLAISDTLNFLKINNAFFKIEVEQLELLPDSFVAELRNPDKELNDLFYIEKQDDHYVIFQKQKTLKLPTDEMKASFAGLVFLIEVDEEAAPAKKETKPNFFKIVLSLVCTVLIVYFFRESSLTDIVFLVTSLLGLYLAINALGDLFGAKNKVIESFCNATKITSCDAVINSKKWKIFEFISFSDLGMLFFSFQLILSLLFIPNNNAQEFYTIQSVALASGVPIIFLSLYYQKFVEKKWCPICLLIITVVVIQISFLWFSDQLLISAPETNSLLMSTLLFALIALSWFSLKAQFQQVKSLKEKNLTLTRFSRNYSIFKHQLALGKKHFSGIDQYKPIVLGQENSNFQVTFFTSPFCIHCKGAHTLMNRMLEVYGNDIRINVFFSTGARREGDGLVLNHLVDSYLPKRTENFISVSNEVYGQDAYRHPESSKYNASSEELFDVLKSHSEFSQSYNFHLTPTIFINGYEFPQVYDREELIHFIPDLLEDSSLSNNPQ